MGRREAGLPPPIPPGPRRWTKGLLFLKPLLPLPPLEVEVGSDTERAAEEEGRLVVLDKGEGPRGDPRGWGIRLGLMLTSDPIEASRVLARRNVEGRAAGSDRKDEAIRPLSILRINNESPTMQM